MKKSFLLFLFLFLIKCASAQFSSQLVLTGTSYLQNFNSLGDTLPSGAALLPTGWYVLDSAVDDGISNYYLGNNVADTNWLGYVCLTHEPAWWEFTSGSFRNYASADGIPYWGSTDSHGLPYGEDTTFFQDVDTNRALGVRQVSPSSTHFPASDPGAAFGLQIANTKGLTGFKATFELQSLDSLQSSRITTWYVDYGFGSNPSTFTIVGTTPPTPTTGGNIFSNTTITVDFGSALDNQSQPVWIRIAALVSSIQTEDRATSAIDNFNLTWSGLAGINNIDDSTLPLEVVGTSPNSITVDFSISQASPVIASVYDMTGREVYTGKYNTSTGKNQISISPSEQLAAGMYFVRLNTETNYGVAKAIIAR